MKMSKQNAEHYTWGKECDGWWLVQNDAFTVIEENMPPSTSEKQHYHEKTGQFFYCLEGRLDIQMDGHNFYLNASEGLFVKAGSIHKVKNNSENPTRFLVISCPNSHSDRIEIDEVYPL